MKNKVMGLVLAGILSVGMVGCGKYNIENKDIYNKGYYEYATAYGVNSISSDYKFYGMIRGTVDALQCDNVRAMEVNDLDGNFLYTVNLDDLDDYEYGMLQFAMDRTKEEREKDLYYIYEIGAGTVLGDMTKETKEIIKKYNDEYVKCYDELLELLKEIENKYEKEGY